MQSVQLGDPIAEVNNLLSKAPRGAVPAVLFLTGSSGCGKTFLHDELKERLNPEFAAVETFDSIGVPSVEEMIAGWGSGEKWQEAITHEWVARILGMKDKSLVIFEGQYHPAFLLDACEKYAFTNFRLAVVTADEEVWVSRLEGPRGQGNLVTDDMRNWAQVLLEETVARGGEVIDTSASDLAANLADIATLVKPLLR